MYSTKPILLLEDDLIDQQAVKRAFEELKIKNKLIIRENGEEGLAYLKEFGLPCLIILDLNMPKMNGMEFLEIVKKDKLYQTIPIIVFTTSDEEREKLEAYHKCIVGYIVKPPDYKSFVDIFNRINLYWTISEGPVN